jgi:DUF4097 and DUF4098 domain-containing protein YvlB
MTDQERILKLFETKKISKVQAEALLEALDNAELDNAEDIDTKNVDPLKELRNYDRDRSGFNRIEHPPTAEITGVWGSKIAVNPPDFSEIFPPTLDTLAYNLSVEMGDSLPYKEFLGITQWVRVISTSGDVRINVDPELVAPIAYGDNGVLPVTKPNGKLNVVVVNEDLELILPRNYGVMLDVKSGDVEIEQGVVLGQVLSGDVTLEAVTGVIITVMSGDVHANLALSTGKHAIKVLSGDANVHLLAGSSVRVEGSVRSGTINLDSTKHKFSHVGYIGQRRFNVSVGKAEAELELAALSGDLSVEAEEK